MHEFAEGGHTYLKVGFSGRMAPNEKGASDKRHPSSIQRTRGVEERCNVLSIAGGECLFGSG